MIVVWKNANQNEIHAQIEDNEYIIDLTEDHCISLLDFVEAAICGIDISN